MEKIHTEFYKIVSRMKTDLEVGAGGQPKVTIPYPLRQRWAGAQAGLLPGTWEAGEVFVERYRTYNQESENPPTPLFQRGRHAIGKWGQKWGQA